MDTPGQTALLVVRHGQSTWNEEHRWQGQADPPLSDHGRLQALTAAASIGTVDAIVSSPQMRALETAVIIGEQIGVGPVQTVEELRERNAGVWSGMTTTEIEENWPGWIATAQRPDGWETDEEILERVIPAILSIGAEFRGATLLVICHGGVIVAIEQYLAVSESRIPNLHGRILTVGTDQMAPGERLELVPPDIATGGGRSSGRV